MLKFLIIFEQEALKFRLALGPASYVGGPAQKCSVKCIIFVIYTDLFERTCMGGKSVQS